MKNVLFVGPYRQADGWGDAAKEYVHALRLIEDINLACRPIYLNSQTNFDIFEEFQDNELAQFNHYDVIIQHCLPELYRSYGESKNIGICYTETYSIANTPWTKHINLMDEMWMSSEYEKQALIRGGVKIPIQVVRIPSDLNKYKKTYPPIKGIGNTGKFNFYFIGEYTARKDIDSLLLAYFRAFSNNDPVRLVLKLHKTGADSQDLKNTVLDNISRMKKSLGIRAKETDYPEVAVITDYLPVNILYGLHQSCDCFVTASYGEAFCIPAFDALMFGNKVVVNKNSSMAEYNPTHLVNSVRVPAIATPRPLPYLYNGADSWFAIDVIELGQTMQKIAKSLQMKDTGIRRPEYDRTNVANIMRSRIYAE